VGFKNEHVAIASQAAWLSASQPCPLGLQISSDQVHPVPHSLSVVAVSQDEEHRGLVRAEQPSVWPHIVSSWEVQPSALSQMLLHWKSPHDASAFQTQPPVHDASSEAS
jgi:hypothetical protein